MWRLECAVSPASLARDRRDVWPVWCAVSPASLARDRRDESGLFLPSAKRARLTPPLSQRVMLYARQEQEDVYTPLHVAPPTTLGLLNAVSTEYQRSVPPPPPAAAVPCSCDGTGHNTQTRGRGHTGNMTYLHITHSAGM